jgi:hypothetical protein
MTGPTTLGSLAKTLRSKNAGVDLVTFDVFFPDAESLDRVIASGVLTRAKVADLYRCSESDVVNHLVMPDIHALKFTIRRLRSSGRPGDSDIFGAQQYAILQDLVIP